MFELSKNRIFFVCGTLLSFFPKGSFGRYEIFQKQREVFFFFLLERDTNNKFPKPFFLPLSRRHLLPSPKDEFINSVVPLLFQLQDSFVLLTRLGYTYRFRGGGGLSLREKTNKKGILSLICGVESSMFDKVFALSHPFLDRVFALSHPFLDKVLAFSHPKKLYMGD